MPAESVIPQSPRTQPSVHLVSMSSLPPDLAAKRDRLLELLQGYGSCAVAFSGGLDSTVVAKAAQLALGDRAVAVTGVSASLAGGELDECVALARQIGIRHEVIHTDELSIPGYQANQRQSLLLLQDRIVRQSPAACRAFGRGRGLRRHESRRPRRTSARHAGRPRAAGPQSLGRVRIDEGRDPPVGRRPGSCPSGTSRQRPA